MALFRGFAKHRSTTTPKVSRAWHGQRNGAMGARRQGHANNNNNNGTWAVRLPALPNCFVSHPNPRHRPRPREPNPTRSLSAHPPPTCVPSLFPLSRYPWTSHLSSVDSSLSQRHSPAPGHLPAHYRGSEASGAAVGPLTSHATRPRCAAVAPFFLVSSPGTAGRRHILFGRPRSSSFFQPTKCHHPPTRVNMRKPLFSPLSLALDGIRNQKPRCRPLGCGLGRIMKESRG